MKKYMLAFALAIFSVAFSNAQEDLYGLELLPINTSKSDIKWSCDYSFYFSGHFGIVKFQEGHFTKAADKITGGTFTIDLNTLIATDMNEEGNQGLSDHLKDADFFEVSTYPTALIVITNIRYHDATHFEATANLTIKGITNPIKFKAELNFEKKNLTTKFKIDRTLWGINYNSKLKDEAISEAIGFEVKIVL